MPPFKSSIQALMLLSSVPKVIRRRILCQLPRLQASSTTSTTSTTPHPKPPPFPESTDSQGPITTATLLKRRREKGIDWHESKLNQEGNETTIRWKWKSEYLAEQKHLDHKYIWMTIGISLTVGVAAFVWVKNGVIENRRATMLKREAQRREQNLKHAERRNVPLVE